MIIIATYKTMLPDTNEKHITDSQFLSVSIEGGPTFHKAHQNWSRFPRLIPTPPYDMNRIEEFLWVDPTR